MFYAFNYVRAININSILFQQTYNLLPPPESSKSRHAKQFKSSDDNYASTASITTTTSVEAVQKTKSKPANDENWLNSSDVVKLGKSNQTNNNNENRNGLKLSTSATASENIVADDVLQPTTMPTTTSSASHYIDAFSDLDPLGTGKIRPYIDKKYFFQDLKNPPKKVLKDLSDRDGFSTNFSSDLKHSAELTLFQEKNAIDNNAIQKTGQESKNRYEQSDEFVAQFSSSSQIFSPNNNGTHGTPPNLSRTTESGKKIIGFFIQIN